MKLLLSLLAAAAFLGAATPSAKAQDVVSMDFFYDNLAPYGMWREVGNYGYCWQPSGVDAGWQPYSDGRWVYTDVGWTWDSYEPFGWAVYHYGRWANLNGIGWLWVPGTEWGPGWVSWRNSPRYVGWAPLPPEALFLRAIGFSGWVDDYYNIGPNNYRFVENQNFGASSLNSVFIDQRQNLQIINQTTNITNISYVNNVVYNGGPGYDQQARYSRSPIQRYQLDRREQFDGDPRHQTAEHLNSRVRGESLSMLALPFSGQHSAPPRRLGEKVGHTEVNHGWKNAGSAEEISAMRERLKSPVRVPEQLPSQPRFERPEGPKMPRHEETVRRPTDQPPPTVQKREDTPRNPNSPPMTPGQRPQDRERPFTPDPGARREPMVVPQRPGEGPNPGGRNNVSDPRRPGGGNEMPPKVERPSEKHIPMPQPQHRQPQHRQPENTPQRPPTREPQQRPEATPPTQRPDHRQPMQRPQAAPTPQPAPQRPPPTIRPAVPPPATPRPPQVTPPAPVPQAPPVVQPPHTREQPKGGGDRPGKERK